MDQGKDFIGEAEVLADGRVAYAVMASGDGVVGDAGGAVSLEEFKAAGWRTDKPLANVGDHALILPALPASA